MKLIGDNVNRVLINYQYPSQGYQSGESLQSLKPGPGANATEGNLCAAGSKIVTGVCYDGVAITFPEAFNGTPLVIFGPGGRCYDSTLTGDQSQKFSAESVTSTGFTPVLKIVDGGTYTATSQNFSPYATYGTSASLSLTTAAVDGTYTLNFSIKIVAIDYTFTTATIKMNGSTVWARNVFGSDGKIVSFSIPVTDTSLSAGQTVEITPGSNGEVSATTMTYSTGTAPTTHTATPSGVPGVEYFAYPPA